MAAFAYTQNFQSLMEMAGLLTNEQFTAFLEDVVFPYQSGAERDTLGFRVLPLKPAFDMTYAALQRNTNIQVMAKHVALDAHAIPNPTQGAEVLEGSIPSVATNITIGKEDYLREAQLLMNAELTGRPLTEAAQDMLAEKFDAKFAEHNARASYMRDYVIFHGKYEITATNNAGSFYNVEFDFGVPAANKDAKTGTAKWWTDSTFATEGSAADPMADLDGLAEKIMAKGFRKNQIVFELGYKTFRALCRHSKIREAIAVFMNPAIAPRTSSQSPSLAATTYGMSDEQLAAQLASRTGVEFITRDFVTGIPVFDQKKGKFVISSQSGFVEGTIVARPKGEVGEIHATGHLMVGGAGDAVHSSGLYDGGRILVDYNCNLREKIQIWDTEEIYLYVLNQGKNMFYLTVI